MSVIKRYHRPFIVIGAIVLCGFLLTQCVNNEQEEIEKKEIPKFGQFAGSASCASCHKDIYEKHKQTGHYLTSRPAEEKYIKGSFEKGENVYAYTPSIVLAMEKRDSHFYQVVYFKGEEKKAMRFDIVTGSGAKGQSFMTWRGNKLFQLPITYFTNAAQWSNSPGFPSDRVMIDRPITSRCMECHVTFAERISEDGKEPEEFSKTNIIYGIDCEKCHGPAAEHVAFQTKNPQEKKGKYILNPASMSRQQNLDLCALCHGGNIHKTKPVFSYTAGETLTDYFTIDTLSELAVNTGNVDVHGNQLGLLKKSKCFRMGETMTCNTCHHPHENQRGNKALFSQKCMSCHTVAHNNFCKIDTAKYPGMYQNCIDCHMPAKLSMSIAVMLPGQDAPAAALVRSHFISIYPEETKKFIPLRLK